MALVFSLVTIAIIAVAVLIAIFVLPKFACTRVAIGIITELQHIVITKLRVTLHHHNFLNYEAYRVKLFRSLAESARAAKLEVVEIGAGTGANLKYYPEGTQLICVDNNRRYESFVRNNADETNGRVTLKKFKLGMAEDLSFIESDSIDAVVCTLVLCSVKDLSKSLSEIRRILKPGGKLFFLEHVLADKSSPIYKYQKLWLKYLFRYLFKCRVDLDICAYIKSADFRDVTSSTVDVDTLTFKPLFFAKPIYNVVKHVTYGYASK